MAQCEMFGSGESLCVTGGINRDHADDDVRKTMDVFSEIGAKEPHLHIGFRLTVRGGLRV